MIAAPPLDGAQCRRHRRTGAWRDEILLDRVLDSAARAPGRVAVHDHAGAYTYRETVGLTRRVMAGLWRLGARPGDVVAVQLPPVREFVPVVLAAERLGCVVSPVIPDLEGASLEAVARLARPRVVVAADRYRSHEPARRLARLRETTSHLDRTEIVVVGDEPPAGTHPFAALAATDDERFEPPARPSADALAELAFTSGTTGEPKGVLHTHNTSLAGIRSTVVRQQVTAGDVVHVPLPVGHNFGYFYGVRLALVAGATLVLQREWDAEVMLRLVARHGVTVSSGTPTHLADLLDREGSWGGRLDTLRLYTCAGAKLAAALARQAVATLPGRLSRAFGMTELGHVTATGPASPPSKVIATEGSPQPEVAMRILSSAGEPLPASEVGQVAFAGPFLFRGYVQGSEVTAPAMTTDGFFLTGDHGYADPDGYLVVTGRVKEIIIRGGENIAPVEIESALAGHPGFLDVAVVGVPDRRLGERPVACVVPAPGVSPGLEEIQQVLAARGVGKRLWPEACVEVAAIPRNETGKILRDELRVAVSAAAQALLGRCSS